MSEGRRQRTIRQRLVAEIGDEGQQTIEAATASVTATGLAGEIEARYLAGAGFGLLRVSSTRTSMAAKATAPEQIVSADAPLIEGPTTSVGALLNDEGADDAVLAVANGAARALGVICRTIAGTTR